MMLVLSDGEAQDSNQHSSVITMENDLSVKIHTVGLGGSTSYFTDYLKTLANNTVGAFYLASDSSYLENVFDDINKKIDIEIDSDYDGLLDGFEYTYGYNPLEKDEDGDDRLDMQEYQEGTDPYMYNKEWNDYAWSLYVVL